MAAEVDRVKVDNGVESLSLSAPLPPPRQQIRASPPVGSSVAPPNGVGPADIVVVNSSVGCAVIGRILCAGDVVINANVGKIEVVLVDDDDVGEDVDGITDGIVDGIVDGIAGNGITDGIADGIADGKETRLKGKGGLQPSAGLIFYFHGRSNGRSFPLFDFFFFLIKVLTHFPIETTGTEQMNHQLWQRHRIGHDVHHAVTSP
jgi:hypothetical protein